MSANGFGGGGNFVLLAIFCLMLSVAIELIKNKVGIYKLQKIILIK